MFVHFVLGWGANFFGIVKGGHVAKSLRTPALEQAAIIISILNFYSFV